MFATVSGAYSDHPPYLRCIHDRTRCECIETRFPTYLSLSNLPSYILYSHIIYSIFFTKVSPRFPTVSEPGVHVRPHTFITAPDTRRAFHFEFARPASQFAASRRLQLDPFSVTSRKVKPSLCYAWWRPWAEYHWHVVPTHRFGPR